MRLVQSAASATYALFLLVPVSTMGAEERESTPPPSTATAPQGEETAGEVSGPDPSQPYLQVIQVTAEKREDDPQDVSVALDVLPRDELDQITAAGEDVLSLSGRSPSLYAESSSGRILPKFYIRGLGNTDFDLNANQPVSLVYDGIVLANPALKGFPVFDLARVEILRGPQASLFGRNTPAGTVKFESAPPTRALEGYVRAYGGRYGTFDVEGAVSGPISERWSARFSGLAQTRDDFVDNTFSGGEDGFEEFEEGAGRLQLLYQSTDGLRALFNLHHRNLDGGSRLFRANVIRQGQGGLVDEFDRERTAQDATQLLDLEHSGGSVRLDWDAAGGTFTSVTGYQTVELDARGDVDGGFGADFAPPSGPGSIPFSAESADNITDHEQITQELRYSFEPAANVESIVGALYFSEDLELENQSFDTLAGGVLNGEAIQRQDTTGWALFGSSRWQMNERWSLFGGLRVATEDKEFSAERVLGPFGSGTIGPLIRDLDDTEVSGDLGLRYDFSPRLGIYGRYARGFRAPNVQGRILFGDVVTVADTETVDSLEAGVKWISGSGRAWVDAAVYGFETDDQQLTAVGGAGNFNQLLNAESVSGYGLELSATLRPVDRLGLGVGFSVNETEIDDPDLQVAVCAAPCTVLDPIDPATGNALIDGNRLPNAPPVIGNLWAEYRLPVAGGAWELVFATDWVYRSRVNFFLYESVEFRDDRLVEGGLRVAWMPTDRKWEVALVGRNVTDDESLEGAIDFNNLSGFVNEPRQYGLEVVTRF